MPQGKPALHDVWYDLDGGRHGTNTGIPARAESTFSDFDFQFLSEDEGGKHGYSNASGTAD